MPIKPTRPVTPKQPTDNPAPEITVTKLLDGEELSKEAKEKAELLNVLNELAGRLEHELKSVISFWDKNSLDVEYLGYLACLDFDGTIYDTTKYTISIAKQAYTYSKLYNSTEVFHTEDVLQNAQLGGEFLLRHCYRASDNRCFYSLTREGKPLTMKADYETEVHFVMAMYELHYATKQAKYLVRGEATFRAIMTWAKDPGTINPLTIVPPDSKLRELTAILRMLLVIAEGNKDKIRQLRDDFTWVVKHMLFHVQRSGSVVLELVSNRGDELATAKGREVIPGNVLEAGWMLLRYSQLANKKELRKEVLSVFVDQMFGVSWDLRNGGILFALDVDGLSPVSLSWGMKQWWTVTEAMIAQILAYRLTGDRKYLTNFSRVFDYAMVHYREGGNGEWYGYLDTEGRVTHTFKGSHKKGCFYVPRCLWVCSKIVRDIVNMGGVEK